MKALLLPSDVPRQKVAEINVGSYNMNHIDSLTNISKIAASFRINNLGRTDTFLGTRRQKRTDALQKF
jgi:hypothetical protein